MDTKQPIEVGFDDDQLRQIDAWARREYLKRATAIRKIVMERIEQDRMLAAQPAKGVVLPGVRRV